MWAECHTLPRAVFCCNWRDYRQPYRARFALSWWHRDAICKKFLSTGTQFRGAARKNQSQSHSCNPRGGIAGWRGSAPRQLQHLVENQLNRLKRAAKRYRLPHRGTENRANRNGALWYHLEWINIYLDRCHISRTHVTIDSHVMHCAIDCHRITPQHKSSETQARYHIEAVKKMTDIFQTKFSYAFLWIKYFDYWHIYASLGLNEDVKIVICGHLMSRKQLYNVNTTVILWYI